MRLGIDFGTTRIVAALVDRGNYPVVSFEAPDGTACEWFPPLVAVRSGKRVYGWEAWAAQEEPGWTVVRSLKRLLEAAGPDTRVQIAGQPFPMLQLLSELASALRSNLLEHSTLAGAGSQSLEAMLGVPANANTNQRYLTAEAFRQGDFRVLGLLNEPSAASIEFGHRERTARRRKESAAPKEGEPAEERARILVYDLGGGTFDASLVELDGREHRVIASEGISTLGGDDFDEILAGLALDAAGVGAIEPDSLSQPELFRLHEECREKKEALHPNTRRITLDLSRVRPGWPEVSLAAADFYERCRPLVEETIHTVENLLAASEQGGKRPAGPLPSAGDAQPPIEALYVTGGGSELPLVARALREVFGRRVRRSAYTRSATAIGLAIQADAQAGYRLRDRFTRYFGVWREAQAGREIVFDPLFPKGALLPGPGEPPLTSSRRYAPVHNIGHFRYLECSHLSPEGRPAGDITLWDEIRFPFDPSLKDRAKLDGLSVARLDSGRGQEAEERYSCDAGGAVKVTIANLGAGYNREYRLGRWAAASPTVAPGRKRRGRPGA